MTIEQLDKIEWLTRAFHADLKANALLAVQEQERKMMLSLGVGEGKISSEAIDDVIDRLIDVRVEISNAIAEIDDCELEAILNYRYLAYKNMQDIADLMHYDKSTVQRKHKKAIEKLLLKSTPDMR
jgi:hypothetical protein